LPRIPTVRNQAGFAPLRLPRPRPVDIGGGAFRGLEGFGQELGRVANKLQDNADELELSTLEGEYVAGIKEDRAAVERNPDFLNQPKLFMEMARKRQSDILGRTTNTRVKNAMTARINKTLPTVMVNIQTKALELMGQAQEAQLNNLGRDFLTRAARTTDLAEKNELIDRYATHVDRLAARGVLNPLEADKKKDVFSVQLQFGSALQDARTDPVGTLDELESRYPLLDAKKMETIIGRASTELARQEKKQEDEEKDRRESVELELAIAAANEVLTLDQLEETARDERLPDTTFIKLKNEIQLGGVTDSVVMIDYETRIRSGVPVPFGEIQDRSDLNGGDKSKLLSMIQSQLDTNHFSRSPEYREAVKDINNAVSQKGPLESLTLEEQQRKQFLMRSLWDRVDPQQGGENAIAVARELVDRIPRDLVGTPPPVRPRFADKETLVREFRAGRIGRAEFNREALLFKQIENQTPRAVLDEEERKKRTAARNK